MPRNLVLFDLEWNIGYQPYTFNYHGVQQTFRGEIIGSGKAAVLGGIAGQNQGVIINCGNRGGKIEAVELDKGVKGENLGGIAGQISKGSDGKGNYIVNCYSWIERVASNNNNIGGIVGIVCAIADKDDTLVIETGSDRTKIRFRRSAISSVEKLDTGKDSKSTPVKK